jgi:hypothetical protein
MKLVGKPPPPVATGPNAEEQAVQNSRYVGQVYIARRKVWEGRYSNYDDAVIAAKKTQAQYPNTKATVVVKQAKA